MFEVSAYVLVESTSSLSVVTKARRSSKVLLVANTHNESILDRRLQLIILFVHVCIVGFWSTHGGTSCSSSVRAIR